MPKQHLQPEPGSLPDRSLGIEGPAEERPETEEHMETEVNDDE